MLEHVSPAIMASLLGLTFGEYLEICQTHRKLLQTRYSEVRLLADAQNYFVNYPFPIQWVIIVEEENPDTVAILPLLKHVANCTSRFELYIVPAERDISHLEQLVEDAEFDEELSEMEFPLILLFDDVWNFLTSWGPRPVVADTYLEEWLENNPSYEELATDDAPDSQNAYLNLLGELTQTMRSWYNSGLQGACVQEWQSLLELLREQNMSDETNEFETDFE